MTITSKTHEGFSTRFNLLLDVAGVAPKGEGRQYRLEKMFRVSNKAAWKWISGESIPRMDMLVNMLNYFKAYPTDITWLLTGDPDKAPEWLNTATVSVAKSIKSSAKPAAEYVKKPIEQKVFLDNNATSSNKTNNKEEPPMNLIAISSKYNITDPRLIVIQQLLLAADGRDPDDVCEEIREMLDKNAPRETIPFQAIG